MTIAALNKVDAQEIADRWEDVLTALYEATLRSAGRQAAARFKRLSPLSAAAIEDPKQPNWTQPNIDELVDLEQIGRNAIISTHSVRLEALAAVLDAYGNVLKQASTPILGEPSFDVTNPYAAGLLAKHGARAGDVAASVRDDLQKIIGDAYQQGLSVNATATQITELSDQFSKAQARMLARTDLNGIANGGSVAAAKEVGVEYKTWLTADDDLVRPTHQDAEGQTVPIDDPFDIGGEALDYPGDPSGSDAEVINCRCTVVYGDTVGDGSSAGDLAAGGAIPFDEGGGVMPEAQIMIPLTFTVGTATTSNSRSSVTIVEAPVVKIKPNAEGFAAGDAQPDEEETDASVPTQHAYLDDGSGQCMDCGQGPGAAIHDTAMSAASPSPTWRAVLCVEGEPTEDGRLLAPGSITWRALPLTLLCQLETASGHDGAEVCGRIDSITREGNQIIGEGVFDSGQFGLEAARLVADETLRGISVDLAVLEYEMQDAPDADDQTELAPTSDFPPLDDADQLFVVTQGVIGAATICAFQAIAQATIEVLTAGAGPFRLARITTPQALEVLTASIVEAEAPLQPPAGWFDDPRLDKPTLLTVTDDGRVFGHVAPWRGCHTGYAGRCVPPPRSRTGYARFHVGRVETAEGDLLPIGRLTLAAPHADINASSEAARRHYDNTSSVAAFVRAGEDAHGVWVAGALRPGISPAMIQDLLANPLSGDWRNGELVAAHAVPVPGFPILQASAIGEDGEEETALILTSTVALVAAGQAEEDLPVRARVLAARARGGIEALADLARS